MEHVAKDEKKLLKRCTLPLTGASVVNMVITDLGVFTVGKDGLTAIEIAPHVSREEIMSKTEATLHFAKDVVQH
jgi:3-oxoacid CoA-transferase subunit B